MESNQPSTLKNQLAHRGALRDDDDTSRPVSPRGVRERRDTVPNDDVVSHHKISDALAYKMANTMAYTIPPVIIFPSCYFLRSVCDSRRHIACDPSRRQRRASHPHSQRNGQQNGRLSPSIFCSHHLLFRLNFLLQETAVHSDGSGFFPDECSAVSLINLTGFPHAGLRPIRRPGTRTLPSRTTSATVATSPTRGRRRACTRASSPTACRSRAAS